MNAGSSSSAGLPPGSGVALGRGPPRAQTATGSAGVDTVATASSLGGPSALQSVQQVLQEQHRQQQEHQKLQEREKQRQQAESGMAVDVDDNGGRSGAGNAGGATGACQDEACWLCLYQSDDEAKNVMEFIVKSVGYIDTQNISSQVNESSGSRRKVLSEHLDI